MIIITILLKSTRIQGLIRNRTELTTLTDVLHRQDYILAYRADEVIRNEVAKAKETKPLYSFTSPDGIRHQVYKISNAQSVENIEKAFAGIDDIYIADGHHRAASAVKVGLKRREEHPDYTGEEEFNYFLSVLFPDEELMIMPYNRVVKDLNGYSKEEFIKKIEESLK